MVGGEEEKQSVTALLVPFPLSSCLVQEWVQLWKGWASEVTRVLVPQMDDQKAQPQGTGEDSGEPGERSLGKQPGQAVDEEIPGLPLSFAEYNLALISTQAFENASCRSWFRSEVSHCMPHREDATT